jgi:hypothetical protein
MHLQKLGAIAAFMNVPVAIAMFVTATVLIGVTTMSDPSKLAELAVQNPVPLFIQDSLKFISAIVSVVLIVALANYLQSEDTTLLSIATGFGFLSILCLVINATLSLYAIFQATALEPGRMSEPLTPIIGILAMSVLACDGIWQLLLSLIALKNQKLPQRLCYLGLVSGTLGLVPLLGIIVLMLNIVWSIWVGRVLWQIDRTNPKAL